jgi:hypothetical protein
MAISVNYGGPGGSGVVIIAYAGTTLRGSGGFITQPGNNTTVHSFYASGTFVAF